MSGVAQFDNVSKLYATDWRKRSGIQAVQGVSLQIPSGSVFGLLGPNRAGKTTLVKMLLSLCRPTSGTITRLGKPVSDTNTLEHVGYMHENQLFPKYLNAQELLGFYAGLTKMPADKIPARVEELLKQVGLADRHREPISRFSKGMVQRLGLAQSLLNDPDLLILDEPTEGLDLLGRQLLRHVIQTQKQRGKTVLIVSHVLSEVEQTCDHVAVIVGGKLQLQSALSDLLIDPKTQQKRTLESVLQPLYEKGA